MHSADTPKQARQQAVHEQARTAYSLKNISVMPIGARKVPAVKTWKQWMKAIPTKDEFAANFPRVNGPEGIGVITGSVSGNLEMLEFEGRAADLYWRLARLVDPDLWRKVTADGYTQQSPSGGTHLYYRIADPENVTPHPDDRGKDPLASKKLAKRPATPEELAENPAKEYVLIETRGEGGYAVLAPSGGPVASPEHPGEWRSATGDLRTIPTITAAERDQLHAAARTFDAMPEKPAPAAAPVPASRPKLAEGELSPIDAYNATHTARELIEELGWHTTGEMAAGRIKYWRPGKSTREGHSATLDPTTGCVYNWSTSTDLPTEEPMSPAGIYAYTHHGGDFSAAARQLRKDGYGTPRSQAAPPGAGSRWIDRDTPDDDGAEATGTDGATIHDLAKKRASKPKKATGIFATDAANADNLVDAHGDKIRYCPERKEWALYTGKRWEWQGPEPHGVIQLLREVVAGYDDNDDTSFRWKQKSMMTPKLYAAVNLAKSDPRVLTPKSMFDAHPYELNAPNGIVDLRTGELHPHDPDKLHSRMTEIEYHPDADPAQVERFLRETFAGPNCDSTIQYLQRLAGHSLIGQPLEHVLPYLLGGGRNGKSVYINSTRRILGDYADALSHGFFMKHGKVENVELVTLEGLRYGVCSEVGEKDVFDESRTKTYTGGDAVKGRGHYAAPVTFKATHSFWLMGNFKPTVESGGDSFWRRLKLIEFPNKVAEEDVDVHLEDKLAKDPALLAWMVRGTVDYLKHGLEEPPHIKAAIDEYAHDEDPLKQFVEECCTIGHAAEVMGSRTPTADVLAAYRQWAIANGYPGRANIKQTKLTQDLKREFGIECKASNSVRYYVGLKLNDEEKSKAGKWMDGK